MAKNRIIHQNYIEIEKIVPIFKQIMYNTGG